MTSTPTDTASELDLLRQELIATRLHIAKLNRTIMEQQADLRDARELLRLYSRSQALACTLMFCKSPL